MAAQTIDSLERLWLEQLARECTDICYQYRVDLLPPVLELSGARRQLGCWLPRQRTIRLSRHLIREQPWEVVLMVLKHEMAHQLCSELLNCRLTGHDSSFRQACRMLGVPPPYNRSSGDLAAVILQPPGDRQTAAGRSMINRIHKLLALAASDNEHEAALAMQRATELLHRHNLEAGAAADSPCRRLIINTHARQIPSFRRAICAILRDHFFVQVICSSIYDPQSSKSFKTIELMGREENVPVAEHCYHFLEQQLACLWQNNRHRFQGNSRTAKNSYYLGLLHGFAEKLAHGDKRHSASDRGSSQAAAAGALAVSMDTTLQDFVSFHFPRLSKCSARGVRIYRQPYDEAVDTGRTIVLHQNLTDKKEGVQGLLKG